MLKSLIQWFVKSSADPERISLTVKSALVAILPIIMLVAGISDSESSLLVDTITDIVFYGLSLVSAVGVVFGFCRKLWNTFVISSGDDNVL